MLQSPIEIKSNVIYILLINLPKPLKNSQISVYLVNANEILLYL